MPKDNLRNRAHTSVRPVLCTPHPDPDKGLRDTETVAVFFRRTSYSGALVPGVPTRARDLFPAGDGAGSWARAPCGVVKESPGTRGEPAGRAKGP